jgi:hypothetical protein
MGNDHCPIASSKEYRMVKEIRQVPKYSEYLDQPGWILERWVAPAYFGSVVEWESRTVPGTSIPKLGPFPVNGDYIYIDGPYTEPPTELYLARVIELWEALRDEMLALPLETYIRKRVFESEERERQREEKWNREARAANMQCLEPYFSVSLEAGKARDLAAEHAGINSHYGS